LLAIATGLASGAIGPEGLAYIVVLAALVVYDLIVVLLAALGIALIRRVFQKKTEEAVAPT
jgi:hypothetical protein